MVDVKYLMLDICATLVFFSKDVLAPQTTARAPMNVPSPGPVIGQLVRYWALIGSGHRLRKKRRPATAGGRRGTDFWNSDSFSLELRISPYHHHYYLILSYLVLELTLNQVSVGVFHQGCFIS